MAPRKEEYKQNEDNVSRSSSDRSIGSRATNVRGRVLHEVFADVVFAPSGIIA